MFKVFTENTSQMSQVPNSQGTTPWLELGGFQRTIRVSVKRLSQCSIEFDMVSVDVLIVNLAFRRVMFSSGGSNNDKISMFTIMHLSFRTKHWHVAVEALSGLAGSKEQRRTGHERKR